MIEREVIGSFPLGGIERTSEALMHAWKSTGQDPENRTFVQIHEATVTLWRREGDLPPQGML